MMFDDVFDDDGGASSSGSFRVISVVDYNGEFADSFSG
jgi:hypothetical protein